MSKHLERIEVSGWKSFDFTLMRDADDETILVSDEIIRDYMSYLATCRQSNQKSLSFVDWISASPGPPRGAAQRA